MIDSLIEPVKVAILILMSVIATSAISLSLRLQQQTAPLEQQLEKLHRTDIPTEGLDPLLREVERRYVQLLTHVDNVDTSEFSAGEIETLIILKKPYRITAAAAQSWIRQAPGILISLGLLGTFAGLTVGLTRISDVLQTQDINTVAAGLGDIVRPMGTAFETSLYGLFLSLVVLIFTQLTGTRTCLLRCETLLSSWLETVLPQRLGEKISTPLRKTLEQLEATLVTLPDKVRGSVHAGMQAAFRSKLNEMFDTNSTLTLEAQHAVRQLSAMASSLNESGQDFVEAALAFRDSDFATTLRDSVMGMAEIRERLTTSTDALAARLADVRDGLVGTQAEWKLLAASAQQELETCRLSTQKLTAETTALHDANRLLKQGTDSTVEATKQLREARLEVMRDRKLALELAEAVQARLASDERVAESCTVFANSLQSALANWNRNVERLHDLTGIHIESLRLARSEDDKLLADRSREASQVVEDIRLQLQRDIGTAIESQRIAIGQMSEPAEAAQVLSQQLVFRLEELQDRIERINNLPWGRPITRDGAGN